MFQQQIVSGLNKNDDYLKELDLVSATRDSILSENLNGIEKHIKSISPSLMQYKEYKRNSTIQVENIKSLENDYNDLVDEMAVIKTKLNFK